MMRRRLLLPNSTGGRLPPEYRALEYLEGTGTQYINVDTTLNDYEFDITFMITAPRTGGAMITGYSSWNDANAWCVLWASTNLQVRRRKGVTDTQFDAVTTVSSVLNKKITASAYKLYAELYDEETDSIINKNIQDCSSSLRFYQSAVTLFHGESNQGYNTRYVSARVYSAKYYLNGTLAYDLVPCIRIADSKPGIFDLVGQQFYTNNGTGEFITP